MADSFIVRVAEAFGTAYNRYVKAKNDGLIKKPEFIAGLAQETKWKGGQTGQEDYAQRRAARNNWFFAGVNAKAMDLSASKIDIYNNPSGLEDEGEKAEGHPFLNVWRRPNPYMGNSLMMQYTEWWLDLKGEAYIFIEPDRSGGIKGLWPLPANAMDIEFTDDNRDIKCYVLMLKQWYRIDPNYIIYIRLPNPFDFFRGMSMLVSQMLTIDIDLAMKTWNGAFFGKDNVMPSAIISLGSGDPQNAIEQKDVDAVTDQLKSEYSAIRRKTVVTNANSMAVALLGYNAKDMDFLAGMQWNKEEILIGLGVPPGMMDKNATEANATVAKAVFKENMWGVKNLIADEITNQALKIWYSDTLEARYKDDRVLDRKALLEEAKQAESTHTIDEIRQKYYQEPPLPAGAVPANKFGTQSDPNSPVNDPNSPLNQARMGGGQGNSTKIGENKKPFGDKGKPGLNAKGKEKNPIQKSAVELIGAPEFKAGHLPTVMLKDLTHNKGQRTTEALESMKDYISKNGITSPVWIVRNEAYELEVIDGKHRIDFAVELDIEQIPVKIVNEDGDKVDTEFVYKEWLAKCGTSMITGYKALHMKGGEGSGDEEGHPFRGNQYTTGHKVQKNEKTGKFDLFTNGKLIDSFDTENAAVLELGKLIEKRVNKALENELDSYMHKAINWYKSGKSFSGMKFFSEVLDEETIKAIHSDLDGVEKQEDIGTIFDYWRDSLAESFFKGGEGSGNFDHSGRPGEIGGSGGGESEVSHHAEGNVSNKVLNEVKGWESGDRRSIALGTMTARSKNDISLLKDKGEVVGVVGFRPERLVFDQPGVPKGKYTYIDGIATKRSGYGKQTMQIAIDKAKETGTGLSLHANQSPVGFYQSLGMNQSKKDDRVFYWTAKEIQNVNIFKSLGFIIKGGEGSGNFGHGGRPGEIGGSSNEGMRRISNDKPFYELKDSSVIANSSYGRVAVAVKGKNKGTVLFDNEGDIKYNHSHLVSAFDKADTIDNYVRYLYYDNKLVTNTNYASLAEVNSSNEHIAINKIYQANDILANIGLSSDTKLEIMSSSSLGQPMLTTLKSLNTIKALSWRPWSGFEELFKTAIFAALTEQLSYLLSNADASMAQDSVIWNAIKAIFDEKIKPVIAQITDQAIKDTVTMLSRSGVSLSFDLTKPLVDEWAIQYAGSQIRGIDATTRSAVAKAIADWHNAGSASGGIDGLKARLEALTDANGTPLFGEARAERIARSEATSIYAGATERALTSSGYPPAVFKPRAHVNCRCYIQPGIMSSGEKVIIWYTVRDEMVCTVDIDTPFGVVSGCKGLHRTIVSEGHAGEKWNGNLWNPQKQ